MKTVINKKGMRAPGYAPPSEREPVVYFIRECGFGFIKIGRTTKLSHRFSNISISNPVGIELLGAILGGAGLEKAIHDLLCLHRKSGEWFYPTGYVLEIIGRLLAFEGDPSTLCAAELEANRAARRQYFSRATDACIRDGGPIPKRPRHLVTTPLWDRRHADMIIAEVLPLSSAGKGRG